MKIDCCFVIPLWNTLADVFSKQLPCGGIDTYFNLLKCLYTFLILLYDNNIMTTSVYMYVLLFCSWIYCIVSVQSMLLSVFSLTFF